MFTPSRNPFGWSFYLLLLVGSVTGAMGAGVTLITHGFNGDAQGWVLGMAGRIPGYGTFPGTNAICYELSVIDSGSYQVRSRKISGGNPATDPSAEIIIKLDWGDLAGILSQYDTYEVAAAVVPRLLQTNFIAELNGHALAELPLHLIGHSRGGSLICEMARLLGTNGLWVDQITTLDPHPVNQDGNNDPLFVTDAPLRIYENVLFADNYYQDFGGYPHGQLMPSSFNRRLTTLPGGYGSAHSDAHLWYHSTIDFRTPANDTEATLSATDRRTWFSTYENSGSQAGYFYSRIGGGNRLSLDKPVNAEYPALGYNQRWNLGAGTGPNRTALPRVTGAWPNCIKANLAGPSQMSPGQSNAITLYYQWARPETTNATMSLYLDDDYNPWNGNEHLIQQATAAGTTASNVFTGTLAFSVNTANAPFGTRALLVRFADGGRTRYVYTPERLTISPNSNPVTLRATRVSGAQVRIDVEGQPGQRVVIQRTSNFESWESIATNSLTANIWSYLDTIDPLEGRFYRAQTN